MTKTPLITEIIKHTTSSFSEIIKPSISTTIKALAESSFVVADVYADAAEGSPDHIMFYASAAIFGVLFARAIYHQSLECSKSVSLIFYNNCFRIYSLFDFDFLFVSYYDYLEFAFGFWICNMELELLELEFRVGMELELGIWIGIWSWNLNWNSKLESKLNLEFGFGI
nr:hypothetical protein [Tanacetum cinerariifolium]